MTLRAIIFDMDGLLIDSEQVYYRGSQEIADQYGFAYSKETYLNGLGLSDEELAAWYHTQYDALHGNTKVDAFVTDSYAHCLTLFDEGQGVLKPGVLDVLDFCHTRGIKTCVASSNTRELVEKLLQKQGILERFDAIFTADDVPFAKPDPALFLAAQEFLKFPKEELLVLEDSHNGILAANRAGISVIMIPDLLPPTVEMQMEAVLESLSDVPTYLIQNNWL